MLIAIALAAASCWKVDEDKSMCAGTDLVLRFTVEDGVQRAASGGPRNIDVFLFDEQGVFVDSRHAANVASGEMKVAFNVEQGVYHAVCWANVDGALTAIRRNGTLGTSFVELTSSEHGSQLWYAPGKAPAFENNDLGLHRVVVDGTDETVVEFTFAKAHRTVEVYAVGFNSVRSEFSPVVEHAGACGRYDFMLQADPQPVVLRKAMDPDFSRGDDVYAATFTAMLHPLRGSEHVRLINPADGAPIASVDLTQYVAANDIDDDSDIAVAFVYDEFEAKVSVQLPRWSNNEIIPEL